MEWVGSDPEGASFWPYQQRGQSRRGRYFYLDATPTHSYAKYLYKYPQRPFPYDDLVRAHRARTRKEHEYELIDTGVFNDDRYFDVFVEYAKASPDDILVRVTVHNRGSDVARLHVPPTLWFRNLWAGRPDVRKPMLAGDRSTICARHSQLGAWQLDCEGAPQLLFTENETNSRRLFGSENSTPFVRALNDGVVCYLRKPVDEGYLKGCLRAVLTSGEPPN